MRRVKKDVDFFMGEDSNRLAPLSNEESASVEKLFASIDMGVVDKLFQSTIDLDSNSIVDFIEALCTLSRVEITHHRVFMLSKVVEVADVNMARIKITWGHIWSIMKEHFWEVGISKHAALAMYGLD
jgi:brefeldin A-inhibited guanine nucleotide-exchange protein